MKGSKAGLTNTGLKYLAAAFMVCDHFAYLLLDSRSTAYLILRGIGRLAAPIFFWAISEGAFHTRNIKKYLAQLLLYGVLLQVVFGLATGADFTPAGILGQYKNIFITLSLGLMNIIALRRFEEGKILRLLSLLLFPALALVLNADYGWYGVLMIDVFYLLRGKERDLAVSIAILNLLRFWQAIGTMSLTWNLMQFLSLLALPLLFLYNGKRGAGNKYFFYLFYPAHLLVLYLLQQLLGNRLL